MGSALKSRARRGDGLMEWSRVSGQEAWEEMGLGWVGAHLLCGELLEDACHVRVDVGVGRLAVDVETMVVRRQ